MRVGFNFAASLMLLVMGCAAPEGGGATTSGGPYRMNRFPMSSPEAEQLKYPPGGGVGAYWLDGRFDITLDVLIDESLEGDKALLVELVCFRQEGSRVFAMNKAGKLLVLDLTSSTVKTSREIKDFAPEDQAVLVKLAGKTRGNIYFDPTTLMPDM